MTFVNLLGTVVAATGLGVLLYGYRILTFAQVSRAWPSTDGEVAVSDLQRDEDSDGSTMYQAEVSYRYEVGGKPLVANRVFFGDGVSVSSSAGAVRRVDRYPAGSKVRVYYDPEKPARAVLEPGPTWHVYALTAIGAVVVLLGVGVITGYVAVE
jgi:hypothetical protein